MEDIFGQWWAEYQYKPRRDRLNHYNSLSKQEQKNLKRSFLENGWCELFCQNHIDHVLDHIKFKYRIDLVDMRIKALKYNKVFLIEQIIWEDIENMVLEYEPLFNSDILFGGLKIKSWGSSSRFFKISAKQKGTL